MSSRAKCSFIAAAVALTGGLSTAHAQVLPDFDPADFDASSATITHPYLSFAPGNTWEYIGEAIDLETGETEEETVIVEVLNETRFVAGIETRIVRDRVFLEGLLVEDTFDWYAQDVTGNVWYMGEDVTDFEYDDEGNLIGTSHPGAWETGVDGALPGYIMPALPFTVGFHFFQEFFEGEAEDHAQILDDDAIFDSPTLGVFHSVLQTADFSLETDVFEHKFYAPGIGAIAEREFDVETGAVIATVDLVSSTTVPEPATALLAATGGAFAFVRRPRRK